MVSLFVHLVSAWVLALAMQVHPVKTPPPKVEERMEMKKTVPAAPTPAPIRPTM